MIKLGDKVKDSITGFEGTAVAKCDYLYGCKQFQVEGVDHDKQPKSWWFDFQRLKKVIEEPKPKKEEYVSSQTSKYVGGPQGNPLGREHPSSMTSDSE